MREIPEFYLVRQKYSSSQAIEDVSSVCRKVLEEADVSKEAFAGKTIGITAGSRGIDGIDLVLKETAAFVKRQGGRPLLFAAMGSHGGGTAEGQREVLSSLNITEETMGAEIRTCPDSFQTGTTTSGFPAFANVLTRDFDGLIVVNRIKMHTDFEGRTESGLLKMLAIGVGNPAGAKNVHNLALRCGYEKVIQETGQELVRDCHVILGLALTENWRHQLDRIVAVQPADFLEKEAELLAAVKAQAIHLPAEKMDALLIGNIGKDISGTGMDTKVIGRIGVLGQPEPKSPRVGRITVLGLTEGSHGNAIGIGLADYTTQAVFDRIDIQATSLNAVTSMCASQGRLPCILPTDREAILAAIETVGLENPLKAKAMYIQDTNTLEKVAVSEALYQDLKDNPHLETIGGPFQLEFDASGKLLTVWKGGKLETSS